MPIVGKNDKINANEKNGAGRSMKFAELKKYLSSGNADPIYLIAGEDAYFRAAAVERLKKHFVAEPQLNVSVFDGENALSAFGEVSSALRAYPFLSEKRMVVLREFYPKTDFFNRELKEYFSSPVAETVFVIENAGASDVLRKAENVVLIDCDKEDTEILAKWVVSECAKGGVSIARQTAEKVADYSLCDMTKISGETKKLIAFAKDGGVISDEDVDALVSKDTEYQIYELTECIGKRKYDKALRIVKDMLSKGEPPQRLIVSIYNYFRRLLHISLSRLSDSELSKLLGVKEYAVKKSREQAKAFKKKSLKIAVDFLADGDYAAKCGKADFDSVLTAALFEILL